MRQTLVGGAVLAVAAALLIVIGEALGLDLEHVALLGAALGAVIGLVPNRSPEQRIVGFIVGIALAWVGYILRAGFLPDSPGGRAVAALVVLIVAVLVAVLADAWFPVPLWAQLLGIAALVGAYEETFTDSPPRVLSESPSAVTVVLLSAAIGFLATVFFAESGHASGGRRARGPRAVPSTDATQSDDVPLEEMFTTKEAGQ